VNEPILRVAVVVGLLALAMVIDRVSAQKWWVWAHRVGFPLGAQLPALGRMPKEDGETEHLVFRVQGEHVDFHTRAKGPRFPRALKGSLRLHPQRERVVVHTVWHPGLASVLLPFVLWGVGLSQGQAALMGTLGVGFLGAVLMGNLMAARMAAIEVHKALRKQYEDPS